VKREKNAVDHPQDTDIGFSLIHENKKDSFTFKLDEFNTWRQKKELFSQVQIGAFVCM
jgi:hypothetical protein